MVPTVEDVTINPLMSSLTETEDVQLDLGCFTLNYPFAVVDIDGETYTISTDSEWETVLVEEETEIVDFVYPLEVTYSDGETVVVEDGEALFDAFATCPPQGGWTAEGFPAYEINFENSCYTIVYPIALVDLAGDELLVNDEEELVTAVTSAPHFFVFPFSLQHQDGEVIEVNDIDEIFNALFSCSGWDSTDSTGVDWETGLEYVGCYTIEFPLDVVNGEGEVVTVNNHMELCDLMLYGDFAGYAYPLSLIAEDGTVTVVNSEDELHAALEECPGWDWGNGAGDESLAMLLILLDSQESTNGCYTVNFPVMLIQEDGTTVVANSLEDLGENTVGVELPIFVTLSDGNISSINIFEDVFTLFEDCQ
ncbi:MAG: hypothetical protein AAGJ82_01420 [Bacteroidota bacterium]